jgi:fucose permease
LKQTPPISDTKLPILLTAAAFVSQTMVGVFHTMLGTALPAIRQTLSMGIAQAGIFGASAWLGFTLAILAGGVLSDLIARHRVILLGCLMMGLSALILGAWSSFPLNCLLIAVIGGGTGVVTSSTTALVMALFPGKEGLLVNSLHFCYALGTIGGSSGMALALNLGWNWRWIYQAGGLLLLILAGTFACLKLSGPRDRSALNPTMFMDLLKEKKMVFLVLVVLLGVGNQNALSYWLVSFLKEVRSFPIFYAGIGLTLFSFGLMTGRLVSGGLTLKFENVSVLLWLLILLNLTLLLLISVSGKSWILVICFWVGLGFSGIFPIALALGGISFPSHQGTAVGILGMAAGVGSTLFPYLISRASELFSMRNGLWVSQSAAAILLILLIVYRDLFRVSSRVK